MARRTPARARNQGSNTVRAMATDAIPITGGDNDHEAWVAGSYVSPGSSMRALMTLKAPIITKEKNATPMSTDVAAIPATELWPRARQRVAMPIVTAAGAATSEIVVDAATTVSRVGFARPVALGT